MSGEPVKASVFDSKEWAKLLPKKLHVVTDTGKWELEIPKDDDYGMGHATNIMNQMNSLQINYSQNTPSREDGDITRDGEPDQLEFDIAIVKDNDGASANPDTLKLDVDITYGDNMAVEFTIEMPDRIKVLHYTGIGSMHDPNSFFGFEDESLEDLVSFFNSWGFSIRRDQLAFIDKYPDSYIPQKTNESIELNPSFTGKQILVLNNSKPQENRYLDNVLKYLDFRGIKYQIASTPQEVEHMGEDFDIMGMISTGSECRVNHDGTELTEKGIDSLECPILGISYGMLSLAKLGGSEVMEQEDLKHGSYKLDTYNEHPLFDGIDMESADFSFSFRDYIEHCPEGYETIGEIDGKIAAIANDSEKRYGVMFHPEDIEYTYGVLDNFVRMCGGNATEEADDLKDRMQIKNVIESFSEFIAKRK